MKGYVKNLLPGWAHAMKRAVGPGAEISLDELYEQYGLKHNLAKGKEFVDWLKNVKLKDTNRWKIILEDGRYNSVESEEKQDKEKPVKKSTVSTKEMEISDIVSLSVRKARETLPKITDLKLLKYSLQEASPLAGKDSLCRVIRKRIKELEISR
jgi:hypothetical protein